VTDPLVRVNFTTELPAVFATQTLPLRSTATPWAPARPVAVGEARRPPLAESSLTAEPVSLVTHALPEASMAIP
jgi:hypothetical protein